MYSDYLEFDTDFDDFYNLNEENVKEAVAEHFGKDFDLQNKEHAKMFEKLMLKRYENKSDYQ
jgi:hypothetical protein